MSPFAWLRTFPLSLAKQSVEQTRRGILAIQGRVTTTRPLWLCDTGPRVFPYQYNCSMLFATCRAIMRERSLQRFHLKVVLHTSQISKRTIDGFEGQRQLSRVGDNRTLRISVWGTATRLDKPISSTSQRSSVGENEQDEHPWVFEQCSSHPSHSRWTYPLVQGWVYQPTQGHRSCRFMKTFG